MKSHAAPSAKARARAQFALVLGFPDREKNDPESKRRARQALQDLN
jgi:hypothetical protein